MHLSVFSFPFMFAILCLKLNLKFRSVELKKVVDYHIRASWPYNCENLGKKWRVRKGYPNKVAFLK